jgi:hypothetical protein
VNSFPGLEGIEETTGKDIAREIIIAIQKKLNWEIPTVRPSALSYLNNYKLPH